MVNGGWVEGAAKSSEDRSCGMMTTATNSTLYIPLAVHLIERKRAVLHLA